MYFHCFCVAILFFLALTDYDEVISTDSNSDSNTKLHESLKLWKTLTELPCFLPTTFFLVLTKRDLFQEKIQKVPLQNIFYDFESVTSDGAFSEMSVYEKSLQFIVRKFRDQFRGYQHITYIGNLLESDFCRSTIPLMCDELCKCLFSLMMSLRSGRVERSSALI